MVVCPRLPLSCNKMVISLILSINFWQCLRGREKEVMSSFTSNQPINPSFPGKGNQLSFFPLCLPEAQLWSFLFSFKAACDIHLT